jgi:hypothetical protein
MNDVSPLTCVECGESFDRELLAEFGDDLVCSSCKPEHVQKIREGVGPASGPSFFQKFFPLFLGLLPSILATVGIVVLRPRFVKMFAEMLAGEPLPPLTRWVCAIPLWGYVAFEALLVAGSTVMHIEIKSSKHKRRLRILLFLIGTFAAGLFMLAMFTPLITLIERLG